MNILGIILGSFLILLLASSIIGLVIALIFDFRFRRSLIGFAAALKQAPVDVDFTIIDDMVRLNPLNPWYLVFGNFLPIRDLTNNMTVLIDTDENDHYAKVAESRKKCLALHLKIKKAVKFLGYCFLSFLLLLVVIWVAHLVFE